MQPDHVLKKLNFVLLTPPLARWGRGESAVKSLLNVAAFRDSHKIDMQHGHVVKNCFLTY